MTIEKISGNLKLRIGDKVVELVGLTASDITNINAAIAKINGLSVAATSAAAADITITDTADKFTATNVEAALAELADLVGDGTDASKVHLADESAGQTDYAKVYKIYQGADDSDNTNNTLVGTINIPKDKVVQAGKLVTVTSNQDSDGDSVTAADGTYIKLTLQNVADPLYINVADLIDVYTATNQGTEVIVDITGNNVTASIGKISGSKIVYREAVAAQGTEGDPGYVPAVAEQTVNAKLTELDTALSTLGITNVAVVQTFTADSAMADGDVEFCENTGNISAVTYTGSNS